MALIMLRKIPRNNLPSSLHPIIPSLKKVAFPSGTYIGHYKLGDSLGIGGMGEVYLAEDTRLERKVALKIMPAELVKDEKRLLRFEQEARAVSALNHPNIITLHEIGQTKEAHFIVTEFIEGETLRQRLSRSKMELLEVLDVAIQTANALVAAHNAGIIHRDIKPDNIMLRPDGYVKVLDFGIAKLKEKNPPQPVTPKIESQNTTIRTPVKTEPGIIIGSPNYMSPEQARGFVVDERSDIFSLGVMIYEMAVGKRPFEGETLTDLIVSILTKAPRPISEFLPAAPEKLDRIMVKVLAKDLKARYQTATELLVDLRRVKQRIEFEAGLEVSVPPEVSAAPAPNNAQVNTYSGEGKSTLEISKTQLMTAERTATLDSNTLADRRKSQRRVLFVLLTLMLLAGATATAYLLKNRPRAIDSLAILPFTNTSGEASADYLSDGITESLINQLSRSQNFKVMSRNSVFQFKNKQVDAREVAEKLNVKAVLTGRVTQNNDGLLINIELIDARDNSQIWGERYSRSMSDLVVVEQEIAGQVSQRLQLGLSHDDKRRLVKPNTENPDAYQLYLRGRYHWNKRTPESMNRGIEYFKQALEKDPQYALAYAGLADCYALLGEYGKMPVRESAPLAKSAAEKAVALDNSLAEAHTSLAAVLEYEWNWAEAEKQYRLAIEMNSNYATAHHWYGVYLSSLGRFDEALPELKKALELDPLSLIINTGLGRMYCGARRYDEAIDQLKTTLEIEPNFAEAHFQLALAYEGKGKYEKAANEFHKAVELFEDPTMRGWIAREQALAGKKDEARKLLDELKTLSKQQYVSPYMIAIGYAALGDREQAFEWLEKVYVDRSYYVVWLKVDPIWDALQSDGRFQDLLRRVGLSR
jgi:eukaryotic-like serine/threonine-protein kinase